MKKHHLAIKQELLELLLAGRDPKGIFHKDVIVDELKKALSERSRFAVKVLYVTKFYIALYVLPDGAKKILGLWIVQTEGAKFWLRVVDELKTRARTF